MKWILTCPAGCFPSVSDTLHMPCEDPEASDLRGSVVPLHQMTEMNSTTKHTQVKYLEDNN